MAGLPYYHAISELPRTLPIFPLPGALLLPRGSLPLNVFEPRYLQMVEDAIAGDRLIGMIQPDREADDVGAAHLYEVGCAGRITQFTETDDGRYLISLAGIARFAVAHELPLSSGGYRRVEPAFAPYAGDLDASREADLIDRPMLIEHLESFFAKKAIEANWEAIEKADDESLVIALAMVCPFAPAEKQALLEARDTLHRAETLIALLRMGVAEDGDDAVRQ